MKAKSVTLNKPEGLLYLHPIQRPKDMKFPLLILIVIFQLSMKIMGRPPKGGIGDGYIYPVKETASNPKTTTTYYAKPLHPPVKKPSGPKKPKPEVFKVIIQNQPAPNAQQPKQEQIFKIIELPNHGGGGSSSGGGGVGGGGGKSVKILKIFNVKQAKDGHNGSCSK